VKTPVRRYLASSPFQPQPEPTVEQYELDDMVSHDSHGLGRVIDVEAAAVTVAFRSGKVRVASPYRKMEKL
jgi:hypothetical protein